MTADNMMLAIVYLLSGWIVMRFVFSGTRKMPDGWRKNCIQLGVLVVVAVFILILTGVFPKNEGSSDVGETSRSIFSVIMFGLYPFAWFVGGAIAFGLAKKRRQP